MTTAVAAPDQNTALAALPPDAQELLKADRQKMGGQFPTIPQIRLANKDMTQAPEGEYFIERKVGEDVQVTPIGKNPAIVVLYKTNTYSYNDDTSLLAWTTDIHGFTDLDNVTLYKRDGEKVVIDFDGCYPAFKKHIAAKYTVNDPVNGKSKKLLKFKTVLYVRYEGEIYKMYVSNASSAGVDSDGKPSFDEVQPKSLQSLMDSWWKKQRASYEFNVMLGSAFVKSSKPYYIMQFSQIGELDASDLQHALKASYDVRKAVFAMDDARKSHAMRGQEEAGQPVYTETEPTIREDEGLPDLD